MQNLPKVTNGLPEFDGSTYYWVYIMLRGEMIAYLTPSGGFSTHSYMAEVFRDSNTLNQALQDLREAGYVPSLTPSDEQPSDPRYHGTQPPSVWRDYLSLE